MRLRPVVLGIVLLAAGCSNGSRTATFFPQAPRIADDSALASATLGGIVNTKTFSVPSGKTVALLVLREDSTLYVPVKVNGGK